MTTSEGQVIEVDGIVTRAMPNRALYEINDGSVSYAIATNENFSLGDVIRVNGIIESIADLRIKASNITRSDKGNEIKQKMLANIAVSDVELLVNDEVTKGLKPEFIEMAKYLLLPLI